MMTKQPKLNIGLFPMRMFFRTGVASPRTTAYAAVANWGFKLK
jgi:hypothetical protein